MTREPTASAVVEVTLSVRNLGSWGPDCTAGQIQKQAVEAARNRVAKLLQGQDEVTLSGVARVTLVTVPV
jgi:hypothetical protein